MVKSGLRGSRASGDPSRPSYLPIFPVLGVALDGAGHVVALGREGRPPAKRQLFRAHLRGLKEQ
eukprot:6599899-Pyramimonas_sp.AAC.1